LDAAVEGQESAEFTVDLEGDAVGRVDAQFAELVVDHTAAADVVAKEYAGGVYEKLPARRTGEDGQIENAVVELGAFEDAHADRVARNHADEREATTGEDAIAVDLDIEFGKAVRPKGTPDRLEIVPVGDVAATNLRHAQDAFGVEADSCDGQEAYAIVDEAQVAEETPAVQQRLRNMFRVHGHAEFAGEKVFGAGAENRKRQAAIGKTVNDFANGAVAADDENGFDLVIGLGGDFGRVPGVFGDGYFQLCARPTEQALDAAYDWQHVPSSGDRVENGLKLPRHCFGRSTSRASSDQIINDPRTAVTACPPMRTVQRPSQCMTARRCAGFKSFSQGVAMRDASCSELSPGGLPDDD
jgi:hypothetical protein